MATRLCGYWTRPRDSLSPQGHHAVETVNFARPRPVPGSLNVHMDALLNQADGTFKPASELHEILAGMLSRPGRTVAYCGVGIAATSDVLALTLLGESGVVRYGGSLHEWTSNPELPWK